MMTIKHDNFWVSHQIDINLNLSGCAEPSTVPGVQLWVHHGSLTVNIGKGRAVQACLSQCDSFLNFINGHLLYVEPDLLI